MITVRLLHMDLSTKPKLAMPRVQYLKAQQKRLCAEERSMVFASTSRERLRQIETWKLIDQRPKLWSGSILCGQKCKVCPR